MEAISGNVTDASGAAVPNAKITITDVGKGVTYTTDDQRIRELHARAPDRRCIRGPGRGAGLQRRSCRRTYTSRSMHVTQVSAQLALGTVGETVSVTAEAPLLKTERADVSDTVTHEGDAGIAGSRARHEPHVLHGSRRPGDRHDGRQRAAAGHLPPEHRRPILGRHLVPTGRHRQSRVGAGRTGDHAEPGLGLRTEDHHHRV